MLGMEANRRVAWAKFYDERARADHLAVLNHVLRSRIEDLLPEFLGLVEDVRYERNCVAFARAERVARLVDEFVRGHPDN
jgi:hypothetical protein